MMATLAVAAGGAAGSLLRYWGTLLAARIGWVEFPWSTMAINIAGSFVIGWFAAATLPGGPHPASHELRLLVMTGLCGGFTTFSAMSAETVTLVQQGRAGRAALYVLLSLGLGFAATAAGLMVARPRS